MNTNPVLMSVRTETNKRRFNMKRKAALITIILSFIFVFVSSTMSVEFWASKHSNKYHYPTCKWAQKIKPENLIIFNSPEEAIKAGYVPCKVCKPPMASNTRNYEDIIINTNYLNLILRGMCNEDNHYDYYSFFYFM